MNQLKRRLRFKLKRILGLMLFRWLSIEGVHRSVILFASILILTTNFSFLARATDQSEGLTRAKAHSEGVRAEAVSFPSPQKLSAAPCTIETESLLRQGYTLLEREQYLLSTYSFQTVMALACNEKERDLARLYMGHALYRLGDLEEARWTLSHLKEGTQHYSPSRILSAYFSPELRNSLGENDQSRFNEYEKSVRSLHRPKNTWISGTLSALVPGAGQVYNGLYQSAFLSFALNALFLSATLELSQRNMPSSTWAAGVVWSVLYVGNIVGSVQATKALNQKFNSQESERLLKFYLPEVTF